MTKIALTNPYAQIVKDQRTYFETLNTRALDGRKTSLKHLAHAIKKYKQEIFSAIQADFSKPSVEILGSEYAAVLADIEFAIDNLDQWAATTPAPTSILHFHSTSRIERHPLGVVLVIAPWNYPFLLAVSPLVAAIAAGNTVILKPSELTQNTSKIIETIIAEAFPQHLATTVLGGPEQTQALLNEKFDHIFFTGGATVAKEIYKRAAEHLTPVTLELGGKSPAIVTNNCDLEIAARRIAWGKFYNAGQTCVAPDYVLVPTERKVLFIQKMIEQIKIFYGPSINTQRSVDYARIINERHTNRLIELLKDQTIAFGGTYDVKERFLSPTIVDSPNLESQLMTEEIFGPILPVLGYKSLDDALEIVRKNPQPLALYLFTNDESEEQRVGQEIQFGGGCINDCLIHLSNPHLPFGGVGSSGFGNYHGRFGFETFSQKRAILKKTNLFDVKIRYAPYTETKSKILKTLLK